MSDQTTKPSEWSAQREKRRTGQITMPQVAASMAQVASIERLWFLRIINGLQERGSAEVGSAKKELVEAILKRESEAKRG